MPNTTTTNVKAFPEILKGTLVAEDDRLDFWPSMYNGNIMEAMYLESFIFGNAGKMSGETTSGYWEFVVLDKEKKIYYIYPKNDAPIQADGIMNHASELLDCRMFGLIVTMLSMAWLGDMTNNERLHESYRNLRRYLDNNIGDISEKYEGMAKEQWPIEIQQASDAMMTIYNFND